MTNADVIINASIYGPTEVALYHERNDGTVAKRRFRPSCEWLSALRWYLIDSKNWRMLSVFSVTDKSLEIQFAYTGGKTND